MGRELVAIDLFSGAGGLAEGLESAGIRVRAAAELHPQPALTHAFNHPGTQVFAGDIRQLDFRLVSQRLCESSLDEVQVVVGGPPCQGFSTAGAKRADDPRNSLFTEYVRAVKHFRPLVFVLENVPGFKKMHGGAAYAEARRLLSELGYDISDDLLQASAYGVPQRRLRFIMVGVRRGCLPPFEWPVATHGSKAGQVSLLEQPLKPLLTVEEALGDLAFLQPGLEAHRHQAEPGSDFASARRTHCELLFNHLASEHRAKAVELFSRIPEGKTIASVPRSQRSAKATMARMDRRSMANAVLALPDDMIHYMHNRIPTVREMARLQTFDDDYVILGKRTSGFRERRIDVPQYTQVGNAVPPLLGKALGAAVVKLLGGEPRDVRDVEGRRKCHAWVRGTSGYSGYTLDPAAELGLALNDIEGRRLPLLISREDGLVREAPGLRRWRGHRAAKRRQWAPGVDTLPEAA